MTRRDWMRCASLLPLVSGQAGAFEKVHLFNGKDFDGWKKAGHGIWSVEEGTIVGRSDHERPGPGYLFTEREFTDFELRLEFWISRGGNSGIFLREPHRNWGTKGDERPGQGFGAGVEVQIDYNSARNPTGSVYNLKRAERLVGGEERWNAYRIRCRGTKIEVWIDEQLVAAYEPLHSAKGALGLQIHGQRPHDHVVRFRNIECVTL